MSEPKTRTHGQRPFREALAEPLRDWVVEKKVPAGIGFGRALGTGLLLLLVVQAVTGMLLALCYSPSPDHAYDSIRFIDEDVAGGRFLRGLHHHGASAVIVLIVAHVARVFFTASYKHPRQALWVSGVFLLLLILGFGFTGYLLPWDQKAFWATSVGFNIAESAPLLGKPIADLLRGGPEVGATTLTRMYAIHVLFLPAALAALAALHLFLVHRLGITSPGIRVGEPETKSEPFFPDHVFREVVVGCAAILVVAALSWSLGPPLEAPAARDAAGYDPRPDWYFLWLFQLLKVFEGRWMFVGTVLLPSALVLGLLLLPFYDRNPERRPGARPIALGAGCAVLIGLSILTKVGLDNPGSKTRPPPRVLSPPQASPRLSEPGEQSPQASSSAPLSAAQYVETLIQKYECLACHTLRGEGNDTGADAPPFEEVAKDRTAEWLVALLHDPKSQYPDTEMPSSADLEMTDQDLEDIVAFLIALQSGRPLELSHPIDEAEEGEPSRSNSSEDR